MVDSERNPIEGARVCYLSGDIDLLCVDTDAGGYYELPDTELDRIRFSAEGFLIKILAAVDHPAPIVLGRSAALLVRVKDRDSDENVGGGEVFVFVATGRRLGPFPVTRGGVRVRGLEPGNVRIQARVEGYEQEGPVEARLLAGEEVNAEVRIVSTAKSADE